MNLRFGICVPVYENAGTVGRIVRECLAGTSYPLLVVDDGSPDPVAPLLPPDPRVRVIRFPENRGKGEALRRGLEEAVAMGLTHLITIDADGQHLPGEIPKLVAAAKEDPWALVIGSRDLGGASVPGVSRFGRSFSNFWVRYQTGTAVADSQSGFRLYPLFPLQALRFFTKRFDFEIEVLIRLLWKGTPIREVPVAVHYPEASQRVSHFDKLWDNVRISLLNTALVSLSLLRSHRSPARLATALGVGAFLGSTPFFGLHTLFAAAAALAFRLNAGAVWLGTQVSIPPLAPLLALASLKTGYALAGARFPSRLSDFTFEQAGRSFAYWLAGSLVVGAALGLVVGAVAYLVAARARTGNRPAWTGRARGGIVGNAILRGITRVFGLEAGYFCLNFIVPYFYVFAPGARRASFEYWRVTEPALRGLALRRRVLGHLKDFGKVLLDRVYQSFSRGPCFTTASHGFEHIEAPLARGEGVILLTAHVGGWDIAASFVRAHDDQDPFHLVQYGARGKAAAPDAAVLFANREKQPILAIHQLLGRGEAVALMGDRPVARHFELVPFFGKLAAIDTTAFRIAAATKKPVVFTFGFKAGERAYDLFARPARYYAYPSDGRDRDAVTAEWAAEFASALEEAVRRYPTQWFNFFPFWSRPPAPPAPPSEAPRVVAGTPATAPL